MPSMQEIRQQFPQYNDMSDADLAKALHGKYYADMPFDEFSAKVGVEEQPATTLGNLKQFGVGLGKGAIAFAGFPGDVNALAKKGAGWVAGKLGASPQTVEAMQNNPMPLLMPGFSSPITSGQIKGKVENVTGPFRQPQNTAEGYADRLGQFAPGMAIPGGSLASRTAGTVLGAFGAEGAGQAGLGPWGELAGGVAGGLTGAFGWQAVFNAFKMRGADTKAAAQLAKELQASGMTPEEALAKAQGMGDEAMLADVSPRMQVATGATAISDPAAQQTIASRLSARRDASPQRVNRALDTAFGPASDPYAVREATRSAKSQISPEYQDAIANAPALPNSVQDLANLSLTFPMRGMSQENRAVMGGIFDQLDDALKGNDPSEVASRLLDLRKQLDLKIVYGNRAREALAPGERPAQELYKQARAYVDEILKDRIPGIAEADALHAPLSQRQAAYDEGRRNVLRGGTEAMTPAEFNAIQAQSHPAANAARMQGVRTEIGRMTGEHAANPAGKAERILGTPWNQAKVKTMIGQRKTDDLSRNLDTEATFLETSNLGEPARGSRTAVLAAGRDMWGTGGSQPGLTGDALAAFGGGTAVGGPGAGAVAALGVAGNRLMRTIASALTSKAKPEVIQEAADILTMTGGNRDQAIQMIRQVSQNMPQGASKAAMTALMNAILVTRPLPAPEAR